MNIIAFAMTVFAILFSCFGAAQTNSDRCGERHKVSKLR